MTSRDNAIRDVPPALAGFAALACLCLGGSLGRWVSELVDAPLWLAVALGVTGAIGGFLLGRAVLRLLYTR